MNNTTKKSVKRRAHQTIVLTEAQIIAHKKKAYRNIMEAVTPILEAAEEQADLNEFLGFGNSVEKPEQELTAETIKSLEINELATCIAEHLNYWMATVGDNIDKAVASATTALFSHCQENKENTKKIMQAIVVACRNAVSNTYEFLKSTAKGIGRVIMLGAAICVKFTANGIALAKQAITYIYKAVSEKLNDGYKFLKEAAEYTGEKIQLFCKLSAAACYLVAQKFIGAAEAFGDWIKEVLSDVKEKVQAACMVVRSWFSLKATAIAEWVKETAGSVRETCVTVWNALDKKVRQSWNKVAEKFMGWINSFKCTLSKLGDKISDTLTKTGDAIISGKDKVVLSSIGKAVKMLSKNYTEDDVIAIVRKAYNEGLSFNADGSCIINESYYINTRLK